jgi:lipopolysaccharide/colanic/teichoic acid biosynthesis glycosyltransferase/cellulose synthase/poly-beta-1,6-N-acetylglucosamine synthase-like glycosyltransferase
MSIETFLWSVLALCAALVIYHHAVFPALSNLVARFIKSEEPARNMPGEMPSITMIVPAYREARFIQEKISDLIAVNYPRHRLQVVIGTDGSPDNTVSLAREAIVAAGADAAHIKLVTFANNRGKVAVLNDLIAGSTSDVVVLSDASATTPADLLIEIARSFSDPVVGVVCPAYALDIPASAGEATYWRYQSKIKIAEAAIAAPMGAHGATYAFRRKLWEPLAPDVINDDFVLPMRIVGKGYKAVYRNDIIVGEREETAPTQENGRRRRIGAGNFQQAWMCRHLLWNVGPKLAFVFASGKVLRALMPAILGVAFLASLVLGVVGSTASTKWPLAVALVLLGLALTAALVQWTRNLPVFAQAFHFVNGYFHAGLGVIDFLTESYADDRRKAVIAELQEPPRQDWMTIICKRLLDLLIAAIVFLVLIVVAPFIAMAIKLSSPGPVFYTQLRVGRMLKDRTELFQLIKFRTMSANAEKGTGAVWASKGDPRITPVGRFLRKTRLDELPQCINVLRGEMSVVGPRPERPAFFSKLESAIPYYTERTFGLKPGVTGLAQVSTGYDSTIEDVRLKVLFDHTYAARTDRLLKWIVTDVAIMWRTIWVMGLGMGR